MAEVVSINPVLSDSTFKTRPDFRSYMRTDTNSGKTPIENIEEKRRIRHMKFPSLRGRADFDSFQKEFSDVGYRKWNDEGEERTAAPFRDYDNIVDPVSGFISVGGDIDRNSGHTKIDSLVQLTNTPQSKVPQEAIALSSRRKTAPELQTGIRRQHYKPGQTTLWNSKQISDAAIKAELGGWTSAYDPRYPPQKKLPGADRGPKTPAESSNDGRDQLALKYMYTTSTQGAYEEVPLDSILAAKVAPPFTTLENKPDMISQRWHLKPYHQAASEWQNVGRAFDWFQRRKSYFKNRPVTFCSPTLRSQHIPRYSGCIGAESLDEIDNVGEPFEPFTIKRSSIPRYVETGHRPDIPNYTGSTLYRGQWAPNNSDITQLPLSTAMDSYRHFPIGPIHPLYKKSTQFAQMVTTVPPGNPFNKIPTDHNGEEEEKISPK